MTKEERTEKCWRGVANCGVIKGKLIELISRDEGLNLILHDTIGKVNKERYLRDKELKGLVFDITKEREE